MIYLKRTDPTVEKVIRAAFPEFTGRDVKAEIKDSFQMYGAYWDEGNLREYRIVELSTMNVAVVPDHPYLRRSELHENTIDLPAGYVVVVHVYSRAGESIELIANSQTITPLLPAPDTLTEDERTVLIATRSRKSSYAGESNYRFKEARRYRGITLDRWNAARESCIKKGMLNKAGAITVDGRNAVGMEDLWVVNPITNTLPSITED